MIISQDQTEIRAAFTLQSQCELKQVFLRKCQASLFGTEETLTRPFSLHLSHQSNAMPIKDGLLVINVQFHVESRDNSGQDNVFFNIDCSFEVQYRIQDESFQPSPESINAFKEGNAIFNCWPYAREFVQDMAARMAVHPPPLPFLRILPKRSPPDPTPELLPKRRVAKPKPIATHKALPE